MGTRSRRIQSEMLRTLAAGRQDVTLGWRNCMSAPEGDRCMLLAETQAHDVCNATAFGTRPSEGLHDSCRWLRGLAGRAGEVEAPAQDGFAVRSGWCEVDEIANR